MQLKPEEISKVIRSQIKYYENTIQQNETGTVLMVGDGIARASGLVDCMAGELLEFEDGSFSLAWRFLRCLGKLGPQAPRTHHHAWLS